MSAYFKFEGELRLALRAEMQGEEVRHISQSRRLRPGDDFLLQDRLGQRFRVKLLNQRRQRLEFEVLEAAVVPEPSPLSLELWLALPKEKALELILQKRISNFWILNWEIYVILNVEYGDLGHLQNGHKKK